MSSLWLRYIFLSNKRVRIAENTFWIRLNWKTSISSSYTSKIRTCDRTITELNIRGVFYTLLLTILYIMIIIVNDYTGWPNPYCSMVIRWIRLDENGQIMPAEKQLTSICDAMWMVICLYHNSETYYGSDRASGLSKLLHYLLIFGFVLPN